MKNSPTLVGFFVSGSGGRFILLFDFVLPVENQ